MKQKTIRIIEDIKKFKKANKTDQEIRSLLGLHIRMYQRYLEVIKEQYNESWLTITQTSLQEQLVNLMTSLENTFTIADKIANNSADEEMQLLACERKDDARMSIVQLLSDPEYVTKVDINITKTQKQVNQMAIQSKEAN